MPAIVNLPLVKTRGDQSGKGTWMAFLVFLDDVGSVIIQGAEETSETHSELEKGFLVENPNCRAVCGGYFSQPERNKLIAFRAISITPPELEWIALWMQPFCDMHGMTFELQPCLDHTRKQTQGVDLLCAKAGVQPVYPVNSV